ncbi:MAG: carboxypeptidase regulatory-like domain-containing protein [Planctomycetes bacterium]|nr:carboxypeptidase regulatory-like domain-containing protein [Planctomycetota bacterium]
MTLCIVALGAAVLASLMLWRENDQPGRGYAAKQAVEAVEAVDHMVLPGSDLAVGTRTAVESDDAIAGGGIRVRLLDSQGKACDRTGTFIQRVESGLGAEPVVRQTDELGVAVFAPIAQGRYLVGTTSGGVAQHVVVASRLVEVLIGLPRHLWLACRVVDLQETAVPEVDVLAVPPGEDRGSARILGRTDRNGLVSIAVAELPIYLGACHAGYLCPEWTLVGAVPSAEHEVRVRLVEGGCTIAGKVWDTAGHPILGAEIVAKGVGPNCRYSWSGEDGEWCMHGLEAGTYEVAVRARAYYSERVPCVTVAGQVTTLSVSLRVGGNVTGRLRTKTGEPVAGARVMLGDESSQDDRLETASDVDGSYSLVSAPLGWSQIMADGGARGRATVKVLVGGVSGFEDVVQDVVLSRGEVLRGVIKAESAGVLGGCRVIARAVGGNGGLPWHGWAESDGSGTFELTNCPHENLQLEITKKGYETLRFSASINDGPVTAELRASEIKRLGILAGRLLLMDGSPVQGGALRLARKGQSGGIAAFAAADGTFSVKVVCGKYEIWAWGEGVPKLVLPEVEVKEGDMLDIGAVRLANGTKLRLSGLLRLAEGDTVALYQDGNWIANVTRTGNDGVSQFVRAGSYELRVLHDRQIMEVHHGVQVGAEGSTWVMPQRVGGR